jgi:hypothetical protein
MTVIDNDNTEQFGHIVNAWLLSLQRLEWRERSEIQRAAEVLGQWSHSQWTSCAEDQDSEILHSFLEWSHLNGLTYSWLDNPSKAQ